MGQTRQMQVLVMERLRIWIHIVLAGQAKGSRCSCEGGNLLALPQDLPGSPTLLLVPVVRSVTSGVAGAAARRLVHKSGN